MADISYPSKKLIWLPSIMVDAIGFTCVVVLLGLFWRAFMGVPVLGLVAMPVLGIAAFVSLILLVDFVVVCLLLAKNDVGGVRKYLLVARSAMLGWLIWVIIKHISSLDVREETWFCAGLSLVVFIGTFLSLVGIYRFQRDSGMTVSRSSYLIPGAVGLGVLLLPLYFLVLPLL